jgi:LAO/AO transport system kinase
MEGWAPEVLLASALTGAGVAEVWATVERHQELAAASGERDRRRAEQAREWMWSEVTETLLDRLRHDRAVADLITPLEQDVERGALSPGAAARQILLALDRRSTGEPG